MEIKKVQIEKINPAPYNPRKDLQPGDSDYESLKKSMDTFGLVEPLVWNKRSGNLVGGHQRLKILITAGFKEAEVSIVDLDLAQEKESPPDEKDHDDRDRDAAGHRLLLVVRTILKIIECLLNDHKYQYSNFNNQYSNNV